MSETSPGGYYVYRTTFTIPTGFVPATAMIVGVFTSDNEGSSVFLNGSRVSSGVVFPGPGDLGSFTGSFTLNSTNATFQSGLNTLVFVIRNRGVGGIDSNPTDTGLRVEFNPQSSTVNKPVTITTTSLPYGSLGAAYSAQLQSDAPAGGMTPTWSVVQGSLPPGLALDPPSGMISGTPTTGGAFSFVVQCVCEELPPGSPQATKQLSIGVMQITTPSPLPSGTVGGAYSVPLAVAYVPGPFSWTVVLGGGSLPPGLQLSGTGALSGTPFQAGLYSFTVKVVGSAANTSATMAFTINITAIITLPTGMVGVNYSQTLTASGGTPPYFFSSPSPPPGLLLNSNGTLSGVPATANTFTFTVTITDSAKTQSSQSYTLTIVPQLLLTTPTPLPQGIAGAAYSQSFAATGGTKPYAFIVAAGSAAPPGLTLSSAGVLSGIPSQTGTFNFFVQVNDNLGYSYSAQFQLTVNSSAPSLLVSPLQLSFTAPIGGDSPQPQVVTIMATGKLPVNFSWKLDAPIPSWLTITPATGTTPGTLVVGVNQSGLAASPAAVKIHITVPNDTSQTPIDVLVMLTLTQTPPKLQILPGSFKLVAPTQGPTALQRFIAIRNSGGGSAVTYSTRVNGTSSWITRITPATGTTPATLEVDLDSHGLTAGVYHDSIHFDSSAGTADLPISLLVTDKGAILALSANGFRFQGRQGAGSSITQSVKVLNLGDPSSTVRWTVDVLSPDLKGKSEWLTANSSSGTATAANPGTLTLSPATNAGGFPVGPRYAVVRVSDPQSLNSPQYINAVLDLAPPNILPLADPSPAGLYFFARSGTAAPAPQTINVYTASIDAVAFLTGVATSDGANWLIATPRTPAASTSSPGTVSVSVVPGAVNGTGVYYGTVNIIMNGALRSVNVTFVLAPPLASGGDAGPAAGIAQPHQAAPICPIGPTLLAVTQLSPVNSFSVPAGWPATIAVQVNDNCGNPMTNASVIATKFSNGDPPLRLSGDGTGTYSVDWQPGRSVPQMAVTLEVATPSLPQKATLMLGAVNPNSTPPPTLVPDGALHIAFDAAGATLLGGDLAPGTITQVYGAGLATVANTTGTVPLATDFGGTFVVVGDVRVPLYYVSDTLVNIQLPTELIPNQPYPVFVNSNGALSSPETINISTVKPGILTYYPDPSPKAQHPDYSPINASSPAKPGEVVTVYMCGMGQTNPSVASGAATPLQQVPVAVQPIITLDGQQVDLLYAGLTPSSVGLYQINFSVPANARAGNLPLIVTQAGVASNTAMLAVSP